MVLACECRARAHGSHSCSAHQGCAISSISSCLWIQLHGVISLVDSEQACRDSKLQRCSASHPGARYSCRVAIEAGPINRVLHMSTSEASGVHEVLNLPFLFAIEFNGKGWIFLSLDHTFRQLIARRLLTPLEIGNAFFLGDLPVRGFLEGLISCYIHILRTS